LEELYRLYCYPVYAFIRRRGHSRQDAQDLTQDFFIHLLEKNTLSRNAAGSGTFFSGLWSISWPMPPNARALPNGVVGASGCFWMTIPLRMITSLRRPKD
jgi:hypothetical protein